MTGGVQERRWEGCDGSCPFPAPDSPGSHWIPITPCEEGDLPLDLGQNVKMKESERKILFARRPVGAAVNQVEELGIDGEPPRLVWRIHEP